MDADKDNQILYYELLTKLIKKGGFILVDNSFYRGRVLLEDHPVGAVIHKFNEFATKDERTDMSMISFADGISLLYVK